MWATPRRERSAEGMPNSVPNPPMQLIGSFGRKKLLLVQGESDSPPDESQDGEGSVTLPILPLWTEESDPCSLKELGRNPS